jgi:hypothetical protein
MIDYICVLFVGEGIIIGLDVSFDNMWDYKGILKKAREVNNTEFYIKNIIFPLNF